MLETFGKLGERLAREILQSHGYEIIATNKRTPLGEIDIVARHGDCMVAVEVKTRSPKAYPHIHRSLEQEKLERLRRCLLYLYPAQVSLRIDALLLCIINKRIRHCVLLKNLQ